MTGRNFIVDPRVKGRVTVISSRPMEADELYQVFLSVLDVHGFAAVPGKNVTKIVPGVNAKQDAVPTVGRTGEQTDGQTVTRVIQVSNVAAAQLVPILRPLMPQEAHLAAYAPTNVLIASGTAANIDRMVDLIRRIDLSSETENEIVHLKHASAGEVERILNALQQSAAKAGAAPGEEVKVIADIRTNSVLLSGDKSSRMHLKRILDQLDTPLESSGNTRVIYLHYAKATELAEILNGIGQTIVEEKAGGAAAKGAMPGVTFKIQPDESTNALVINAPPDVMRDLEGVIRRLDLRRAQVMVKAVIAEVGTNSTAELGIHWAYDNSDNNGPIGLIDFKGTIGGIAGAVRGTSAPPELNGLSLAGGDFTNGVFKFGALIRALAGDADNNIISTPTLVTMDNEEAEIVVGQNVPFITGSFSSTGGGSTPTNPFQTIQREDVGLKLKIKPQINEGDAIRLEISQELSSLDTSASSASDLITNKRSVKTTVMVDDGKVLVLGGLLDDTLNERTDKVPLLGDIPVLGWLFRHQSTTKSKKDLMVFLHPRILRDGAESTAMASDKYNYIRALQLDVRQRGVKLMRDDISPLLPEMEEFLELPPPYEPDAEPSPQALSMEHERVGAN
jgi:general secretion pathway protein D